MRTLVGDDELLVREALVRAIARELMLPDGSGIAVVAELKAVNPDIAIAVMTGFGIIQSAVAAIKAGATEPVSKPLDHHQMTLDEARWDLILRTLAVTNQNISETARRLGIRRQSLQRMLKKLPPPSMV